MAGVPPRLASLLRPPITFAHRGGRAHAPENTLEAFALALRLGARGLETDAWVTADGVAVLTHSGTVGTVRRRRIGDVTRAELPVSVPSVAELFERCGDDYELSVDVKDPAAAGPVIAAVRAASPAAVGRLWLCHDDHDLLVSWREAESEVRLVDSTRLKHMKRGPERHAAVLEARGIHAVNLHESDWTGGLTTLFHRFGILAFGWDCQFERILLQLLDAGIDAVYSDHVDRMVDALARIS
jgi:glycerophosphoryl diester phosphodiesterase